MMHHQDIEKTLLTRKERRQIQTIRAVVFGLALITAIVMLYDYMTKEPTYEENKETEYSVTK